MRSLGRYLFRLLVALDQGVNALLGGDPDETVSSRAEKARRRGRWWGRTLCAGLDLLDPDHCRDALEPDRGDAP